MGEIEERVEHIRNCVKGLERLLREREPREIVNDFVLLNAVLHMLQTSIQSLIDCSARILSELGERPPRTYGEIPETLARKNILPSGKAETARKMIGFRNVLVHTYLDLDAKLLLAILEERKFLDILDIALELLRYAQERGIDP